MKSSSWLYLAKITILVIVYYSTARIGSLLALTEGNISPVWPPTGVALAALLLFGSNLWPGVGLGAFLAAISTGISPDLALGAALVNSIEALLGVHLLQGFGFRPTLKRVHDILGLVLLAGVVSPMFSALIGTTTICLRGLIPWSACFSTWWVWWLGDTIGMLVVAPVLLTWATWPRMSGSPQRILEGTAWLLTLMVVTFSIFGRSNFYNDQYLFTYLFFPLLIWAAFRFGQRGVTTANLIILGGAIWGTTQGYSPSVGRSLNENFLSMWLFMSVMMVTAMLLAAIIAERHQTEAGLRESETRYRMIVEDQTKYIAERQQAEKSLRQEQHRLEQERQRLRTVLDILPFALWVIDAEGQVIASSAASKEVWAEDSLPAGAPRVYKGWWAANGRPLLPEDWSRKRTLISGEVVINEEIIIQAFDGCKKTILNSSLPIREGSGNIAGAVVLNMDITSLKRTEQALRESEAAARHFQEQLKILHQVSIELARAASFDDLTRLAVELGRSRLGFDRLGLWFIDPNDPRFRLGSFGIDEQGQLRDERGQRLPIEPALLEVLDQQVANEILPGNIPLKYHDHYPLYNDKREVVGYGWITAAALWDGSEIIGFLCTDNLLAQQPLLPYQLELLTLYSATIAHLSTRKRAETALQASEERLRQSQKMEAVGRLAGGIAHDFNNILTVIIGNCELILSELDERHPLHRDIAQIKKAGERAASLTSHLLAFSRQQMLQPIELNLNQVIMNLEPMLQRLIGEDIELEAKLDPNLGVVKADPGQIEQVIMNLVINARDAMVEGGRLSLETRNIAGDEIDIHPLNGAQPNLYVLMVISDTGSGMDKNTQVHIFEPFFTTKEQGKGTGLGLAVVHGIISQSGGQISVSSQVGQGTTFNIYLPCIESAGELISPAEPASLSWYGAETILLVEDEEMVREIARRILMKNNYTVLEAHQAIEAIELCRLHRGPIHLLLTDVIMPGGMSGRQLAERLSSLYPEMKTLYISGYTDTAIMPHGVLDPNLAFLQKPFTPDALMQKVREVLDQS